MSSESIDKRFHDFILKKEVIFNIKDIVIPFTQIFPKNEEFIYNGSEKIPFKNRHPIYKAIFLNEFQIKPSRSISAHNP
jgi:hypothetical protein